MFIESCRQIATQDPTLVTNSTGLFTAFSSAMFTRTSSSAASIAISIVICSACADETALSGLIGRSKLKPRLPLIFSGCLNRVVYNVVAASAVFGKDFHDFLRLERLDDEVFGA
jgi:hypothetical protein